MLESVVRQFLYHPTFLSPDAPPPSWAAGSAEVWFESEMGDRLHGLHWAASADRPTVLFFHGNAQSVFEWALVREDLVALDCGLFLIDYPGYGKSSGRPNESGFYAAGQAALSWLTGDGGVSPSAVIVFGKSLGGPVAAKIAADHSNLRGVVLESTFRSIPHVARVLLPMLPVGAVLKSERYETEISVGRIEIPLLVIHGTQDTLIPVGEGESLFESANCAKELYLVTGAGHNDVAYVAGRSYGKRIMSWLES